MPPMKMNHDTDPKKDIIDAVGNLDDFKLFNMQVLVGIYIRPQKTASGIYLTDKTTDEDRYQGKVGLILKTGPMAFVEDEPQWFKDMNINVGDWAVFKPSDGWAITINGYACRILDDRAIRGTVERPDMVW